MADFFLTLDENIFLFLNNLGNKQWDRFWLHITDKWTSVPLYAVLLFCTYQKLRIKQFFIIVLLVALLITFTDQTANLFKNNFQRLRPCNFPYDDRSLANCGKFGFFSAHAASSMALAIFIGGLLKPYYKHIRFLLIIWSLLLGYSRIYVGVHFPGDVLAGFVIGFLYGHSFLYLKSYLSSLALIPQMQKEPVNLSESSEFPD